MARKLRVFDARKLKGRLAARYTALYERFGSRVAKRLYRRKTVASGGRVFSARVSQKVKESTFTAKVSGGTFQQIVKSWPDRVDERLQALLDDVAQQAFESVINRTAVLSGEAAESWFVTNVNKYRRFIANNAPHIRRLEHGWSKQPNRGFMVKATMARIPQMVEKAAGRLKI